MKIIKFDHLTYVDTRNNKGDIIAKMSEMYILNWKEENRLNIQSKNHFFSTKHVKHDLMFWESTDKNNLAVEVVLYDSVYQRESDTAFLNNKIYAKYNDAVIVKRIMEFLGAKCKEESSDKLVYSLKGILDKTDILLHLIYAEEKFINLLDRRGYGCIALLTQRSDCSEDKRKVGYMVTEPETFMINGRNLKISFLCSDSLSIIFELITLGEPK